MERMVYDNKCELLDFNGYDRMERLVDQEDEGCHPHIYCTSRVRVTVGLG